VSADGDSLALVGQPCIVWGCPVNVAGDARCTGHGGKPDMEWQTDAGGTTFSFHVESEPKRAEAN
jgi:hypothetical protein